VRTETPIAASPAPDAVRVDPVAAAHAAGEVQRLVETMRETVCPLLQALEVSDHAFGSGSAAPAVAGAHQVSLDDLTGLIERLTSVLEGDIDRLYRVAFAVREAERATEQRVGASSARGLGA
jgi:hypothetical protein